MTKAKPAAKAEVTDEAPTSHSTLAEALIGAQSEMPAVTPDGSNPHFNSKFVTLGKLIANVRPVLNRHGVAVVQMPGADEQGKPVLTTHLLHASGESMAATMPLLLAKNDPQALGSALTYAKRYALSAALGISDQEDDDGHAGSQAAPKPIDSKRVDYLVKGAKAAGLTGAQIVSWLATNLSIHVPEGNRVSEIMAQLTEAQADALQGAIDRAAEQGTGDDAQADAQEQPAPGQKVPQVQSEARVGAVVADCQRVGWQGKDVMEWLAGRGYRRNRADQPVSELIGSLPDPEVEALEVEIQRRADEDQPEGAQPEEAQSDG